MDIKSAELAANNESIAAKAPWYKRPGIIATGAVFAVVGGVYVVATPFVTPAFRRICLPFVPATEQQVKNVFKVLDGRKGTLVDLGSGDGRLVSIIIYSMQIMNVYDHDECNVLQIFS